MLKETSGLERLGRVETTSLHQKIYDELRQAIMSGHFRPGESLTLRGLAAALGTSIMPARDAVLRLTAERALEAYGRGVRIPVFTLAQFKDMTRFRVLLEGEAAALAAERATPSELDEIERLEARARKLYAGGQVSGFLQTNQAFHFAVYRAAHSEALQSMIESLWLQVGPHLHLMIKDWKEGEIGVVDNRHHENLVAALRRGDPAGARDALVDDIKNSADLYRPIADQPDR